MFGGCWRFAQYLSLVPFAALDGVTHARCLLLGAKTPWLGNQGGEPPMGSE
jgi:hypothetical protein